MLKVKIKATGKEAEKVLKAGKKFVYATKTDRESPGNTGGRK